MSNRLVGFFWPFGFFPVFGIVGWITFTLTVAWFAHLTSSDLLSSRHDSWHSHYLTLATLMPSRDIIYSGHWIARKTSNSCMAKSPWILRSFVESQHEVCWRDWSDSKGSTCMCARVFLLREIGGSYIQTLLLTQYHRRRLAEEGSVTKSHATWYTVMSMCIVRLGSLGYILFSLQWANKNRTINRLD